MLPSNLFLIRHLLSAGNQNKQLHLTTPDFAIPLAPEGLAKAESIARQIEPIAHYSTIYCSPYFRTRQTWEEIEKHLKYSEPPVEDPRLREQDAGNSFSVENYDTMRQTQIQNSTFWHRLPGGESGAEVFDRVSSFWSDLIRDNSGEPVIIIGHGFTNRIILMKALGLTVEQFELILNPANGEVWHLSLNEHGNYFPETLISKREKSGRIF